MEKKLTTWQKEKRNFEKKRTFIIKELDRVEKKHGTTIFRSAVNRKITIDKQKEKRKSDIIKAQEELEQLKKGIPVTY